jgi:hypothetical protein
MAPKNPAGSDNKKAVVVTSSRGKAAVADRKAANGKVPPAEDFWLRYSPHHEFPLSSGTSVALHILVIVMLALGGWIAYKLGWSDDNKPPEVSAVVVDPGGGGSKHGVEGGTGAGAAINADADTQPDPAKPLSVEEVKDLKVPQDNTPQIDIDPKDTGSRPISAASQAIKNLAHIDSDARSKLMNSLAGDKGKGGSGKGGGYGSGIGTGTGGGTGKGKGGPTVRQKRVQRWSMTFNTQSGDDYARQLAGIKPGSGAVLAIPVGNHQYKVIRDLNKRPVQGRIEDLDSLHSIFWVDEKPESVANLARALQINPAPPWIAAFFPPELENELLRQEREKSGGAKEDDIEETRYVVVKSPDGYRPQCISCTLKGKRR